MDKSSFDVFDDIVLLPRERIGSIWWWDLSSDGYETIFSKFYSFICLFILSVLYVALMKNSLASVCARILTKQVTGSVSRRRPNLVQYKSDVRLAFVTTGPKAVKGSNPTLAASVYFVFRLPNIWCPGFCLNEFLELWSSVTMPIF